MEQYLQETRMLDYSNKSIQDLIEKRDWKNQDFGVYDSPDELLKEHHQEMSVLKAFAYKNLGRHLMNHNVKKIRNR